MPIATPEAGKDRLKAFKNKGKDQDELRRRRNEVTVDLRKSKKDDLLSKRRNVCVDDDEPTSPLQDSSNKIPMMSIEEIQENVYSSDFNTAFKATQAARKILSRERNPPIDALIQAGIVPQLIKFLSTNTPNTDDNGKMQFESAWALTNIASGTALQTRCVVEHGATIQFIKLLSSPDLNVCEQAVWALGNIAGDGTEFRDLVTEQGIVKPLLALVASPTTSDAFMRNIVWTMSNLCRNKNPSPKIEVIQQILPTIVKLLGHHDNEVLADTCWALSYLTDGSNDRIQYVVDSGAVPLLVRLLTQSTLNVITPALRAVGNIVTGSDQQTDAVIQAGGIQAVGSLLTHEKMNVVKEAAWTISNITAGPPEQIQIIIGTGILPPLIEVLKNGDFRAKKEAAWAVTNLTSGGTLEQIVALCTSGVMKPFCDLLDVNDEKTLCVVMDGLVNLLAAAASQGEAEKICEMVEECEGLDKLEALQQHENELVYKKALHIIETYFAEEDEAPEVETNGQEFAFSQPATSNPGQSGGFNF